MRVHLSGVCGTAMASLAGLLIARGDEVSGSDQDVYPPMSDQLAALGLTVLTPYSGDNVSADADLVVIGNALSRGNPEVEAVLERRQKYTSLPALLADEFIRHKNSIVIAGTHGKTTTSSIAAFLLHAAGQKPSFLIGGVPIDFGRSYRLENSDLFITEGDEYDCAFFDKRPKFVHYRPDIAVIGNVEYDHADIYPDLAAVQKAFMGLLNVTPRNALLIAGAESPALAEILPRALCRVQTFALESEADWCAADIRHDAGGSSFQLIREGCDEGRFALTLPGDHNLRNALAALAVTHATGASLEVARRTLPSFRGVRRRLELRGNEAGVDVYDDFAHHPTAVRETLRAMRNRNAGRLIAVFEPRSFTSRTSIFRDDFSVALAQADIVVIAAAYLSERVPPERRLSEQDLAAAVRARGASASFVPQPDEIVEHLDRILKRGDRVVILSNGGFGAIHERLLARLRART